MKVYELTYIERKGFEFRSYDLIVERNVFYTKHDIKNPFHKILNGFKIELNEVDHHSSLDKYFTLYFIDVREKERQFQRLKKFILNIADNEIKNIEDKKKKIKDSTI
jgi:hypothetical protein